ncbi:hypothetical protein F5Y15DRAFT_306438 [Xylariaceae sp. FL0016]|nr:hypothetical protein F5Y15DRAFT_306438 [Xylariaceae sp. FL0016]
MGDSYRSLQYRTAVDTSMEHITVLALDGRGHRKPGNACKEHAKAGAVLIRYLRYPGTRFSLCTVLLLSPPPSPLLLLAPLRALHPSPKKAWLASLPSRCKACSASSCWLFPPSEIGVRLSCFAWRARCSFPLCRGRPHNHLSTLKRLVGQSPPIQISLSSLSYILSHPNRLPYILHTQPDLTTHSARLAILLQPPHHTLIFSEPSQSMYTSLPSSILSFESRLSRVGSRNCICDSNASLQPAYRHRPPSLSNAPLHSSITRIRAVAPQLDVDAARLNHQLCTTLHVALPVAIPISIPITFSLPFTALYHYPRPSPC